MSVSIKNAIYLFTGENQRGLNGYIGQAVDLSVRNRQHISRAYYVNDEDKDKHDGAADILQTYGAYHTKVLYGDAADIVRQVADKREDGWYIRDTDGKIVDTATDLDVAETMIIFAAHEQNQNLHSENYISGGQKGDVLEYTSKISGEKIHVNRWENIDKAYQKFINPEADANGRKLGNQIIDKLINPKDPIDDGTFRDALNQVVVKGFVDSITNEEATLKTNIKKDLSKLGGTKLHFKSGRYCTLKEEVLGQLNDKWKKANGTNYSANEWDIGDVVYNGTEVNSKFIKRFKALKDRATYKELIKQIEGTSELDPKLGSKNPTDELARGLVNSLSSNGRSVTNENLQIDLHSEKLVRIQSYTSKNKQHDMLRGLYDYIMTSNQRYQPEGLKDDAMKVILKIVKEVDKSIVKGTNHPAFHAMVREKFRKEVSFTKPGNWLQFISPVLTYYMMEVKKKQLYIVDELLQHSVLIEQFLSFEDIVEDFHYYQSKFLINAWNVYGSGEDITIY